MVHDEQHTLYYSSFEDRRMLRPRNYSVGILNVPADIISVVDTMTFTAADESPGIYILERG